MKSPRHVNKETGRLVCLALGVAAVVLVAHWPALDTDALSFDDDQYLVENHLVRNPSWSSAHRFVTEVLSPSTVRGYYQPLTMISLMIDYGLGGRPDDLRSFRRTSLALHVLNTMLVVLLLYRLFDHAVAAGLAGLLFGLHPMTVETICWVGERKTLLAAFFALASLVSYVQYVRGTRFRWLGFSFVFFGLALLSKPTATPLPLCLLLLDYWPLARFSRRAVLEKVPFVIVAVSSAWITYVSQKTTAGTFDPGETAWLHIPLILCHNIVFYLYHVACPVNLSSHYPFPQPLSLSQPMVLAGVIGTCVLIPALLLSWRWTRAAWVGWLYFFIAILPAMQIIGFSDVIASDKFAYLPAVGLLLTLTCLLRFLGRRVPGRGLSPLPIAVGAGVLLLAGLETRATRAYQRQFADTETLYRYMIERSPSAHTLYGNLGVELLRQERLDEAAACFDKSLELYPEGRLARMNLAIVRFKQGNSEAAISAMREVLALVSDRARFLSTMGWFLSESGRDAEAIDHLNRALRIDPEHAEALNTLGLIMLRQSRWAEADDCFARTVQIQPWQAQAQNNRGLSLLHQAKFDEAIERFRAAVDLDPMYARAWSNLALALERRGQPESAIDCYQKTLVLDPRDANAHNNLGACLARMSQFEAAIGHFESALAIEPGHRDARRNLSVARRMTTKGTPASQPE